MHIGIPIFKTSKILPTFPSPFLGSFQTLPNQCTPLCVRHWFCLLGGAFSNVWKHLWWSGLGVGVEVSSAGYLQCVWPPPPRASSRDFNDIVGASIWFTNIQGLSDGVKPSHNLWTLLTDLLSFLALDLKYPCRQKSSKPTTPVVRNFTWASFSFHLLWKIASALCVVNELFEGQAWDTGFCRSFWPSS